MERFYEYETLGVQASDCQCPKTAISAKDRMAMNLFEASCSKEDNRYVIGLPWKKDSHLLPNNYPLAERRLESLERSLLKNETKVKMYNRAIEEYVENGRARPLTKEELKQKVKPVYYLPHHGVYRPDKPSTPLRVVFDPARQYQGVSLNSFLCKGPCLIGNLLGVLLRFREDPVGFAGDISKMYLQILLPESKEWYCSSNSAKNEMQANNLAKPATPEVEKPKASQDMASPLKPGQAATEINLDGERGQIKTLGVGWNPQTDTVNFTVKNLQLNGKFCSLSEQSFRRSLRFMTHSD